MTSESLTKTFATLHRFFPNGTTLGLHRIEAFLDQLGNPHRSLPPTLHIAGTNGKGSTHAFLKTLFQAFEKDFPRGVHSYTSPHLVYPNERISLNGSPITDPVFEGFLTETLPVARRVKDLSWFEFLTGTAFLIFSRIPADILILETGLGGRLDATNMCQNPIATLITPISRDHEAFLGDTLPKIAFEKAGIFKPGVPVFTAPQEESVMAVLSAQAALKGCPLYKADRKLETGSPLQKSGLKALIGQTSGWSVTPTETGFTFKSGAGERSLSLPLPSLLGPHQLQNAGLALKCFLTLFPKLNQAETLGAAMGAVRWPGRLQRLEGHPFLEKLPSRAELWVDGAHNGGAALALKEATQAWSPPPLFAVSLRATKKPEAFLEPLVVPGRPMLLLPCPEGAQGHPPEALADLVTTLGGVPYVANSLTDALEKASDILSSHPPTRLLFCGSLYTVGALLKA